MSHYETLGVDKGASTREIRAQFQRLSLIHHPDKGSTDDSVFIRLREAYEVLADAERRAKYDAGLLQGGVETAAHAEYDLSEFDFDEEGDLFAMACRCGGWLRLRCAEMEQGCTIATCEECSLRVRVLYQVAA